MRKPVYLAVVGISIVVAAGSLGVTLTRYLDLLAYAPKGTAQTAVPPDGRTAPATPPEEWNNLFAPGDGMKLASRLPAANAKGGSQGPRTAFVLVGTIVSSTPSARRAILWASGMKEPKAFRIKEEVEPGAFLASVERGTVWLSRGNEREKLEILPVGSQGRPTPAGATAATPVPPPVATAAQPGSVPGIPSAVPYGAPAARTSPGGKQMVAPDMGSSDGEWERIPSSRGKRRRSEDLRQ